jgi:hypothetical protein
MECFERVGQQLSFVLRHGEKQRGSEAIGGVEGVIMIFREMLKGWVWG